MGPSPRSGPTKSRTRQETSTAPVAVRDIEALRHRGRGALSDGDPPHRHGALALAIVSSLRAGANHGKHSPNHSTRNVFFVGLPRTPTGRAREPIARLGAQYPGT